MRDNPRCSCADLFDADFDAGADFDFFVDERCDFGGKADAAVRGRVAGQDANVHADGPVESAEPAHGRALVTCSAWCRIYFHRDASADDSSAFVHEVAVGGGAVILVFFGDCEAACGGHASAFTARDWCVYVNLFASHEVGTLFGNGDEDVGVVGVDDAGKIFIDDWRGLFADEFAGLFHRSGLRRPSACCLRQNGRTAHEERVDNDGDEEKGRVLHRALAF